MRGRAWTPEEDAALMDACATCKTWAEVAGRMPDRTERAVSHRGYRLGVTLCRVHKWTHEEVKALRENYPMRGPRWAGWADLLSGRTMEQIRARAGYDGLKQPRSKWTAEEDRALSLVLMRLSRQMGRSATCIASRMGALARKPRAAAL